MDLIRSGATQEKETKIKMLKAQEPRLVMQFSRYSSYSLDSEVEEVLKVSGLLHDAQKLIKVLQGSPEYQECLRREKSRKVEFLKKQIEELQT